MNKYGVMIYWSGEDQVYVAEVPELPGCVTHGDTPESALANANEAVQLWIDTAAEFGNRVPAPKGDRSFAQRDEPRAPRGRGRGQPVPTVPVRRKNRPRAYYNERSSQLIMNPNAR